ncbi:F-box/kelch-repeat protein At3g27150 [Silene latifolia]|uniref:F-box/kelch-repeat protein At3g27150 n=1 Tax=Silene latifolia TaxID=37657 RepID=UPI003D77FBEB
MSRGREIEDKEVDVEEINGDDFDESEYEGEDYYDNEHESDYEVLEEIDRRVKIRRCDSNPCFDHGRLDLNLDIRPSQDADYWSNPPHLSDELGLISLPRIPTEVETMIIARIPLLEIRKFCSVSKPILTVIKNGDIMMERKRIGVKEASVFMLASGETNWWAFDQQFLSRKTLPNLPSDVTFKDADKESLCAGTQLLVFGKEAEGPVIWAYEVLLNKWFKSTSMIEPRCLFASASSGDFAYAAGGTCLATFEILNSAEKYDPDTKTWDPLPKMKEKRRMCSGVYMDNKFYVLGGQSQSGGVLTCGEVYDENKNTWVKIPGILTGLTNSDSPPLLAVVNNELYTFETSTNCLLVYLKDSNSWKDLGQIPVRADSGRGWGVAFKSLGNELLAIGGSNITPWGRGMTVYTCSPNPNAQGLEWKLLDDGRHSRSPFVMNCTVMVA